MTVDPPRETTHVHAGKPIILLPVQTKFEAISEVFFLAR